MTAQLPGAWSGTVTHINPLRVLLDGATQDSPAYRDASYSPAVNDRVGVIAYKGSQLWVMNKEAT